MITQARIGTVLSHVQPVALVGAAGALGFWLGEARDQAQMFWPLAAIVLAVAAALLWQLRPRGSRHVEAVWNAYADREIARRRLRQTVR